MRLILALEKTNLCLPDQRYYVEVGITANTPATLQAALRSRWRSCGTRPKADPSDPNWQARSYLSRRLEAGA